jgi:hypothetical protein
MGKKASAMVWCDEHDRRLPMIMKELGDGVNGVNVTGKNIKDRDNLFSLIKADLLARRINSVRKRQETNGKWYNSIGLRT